MDFVPQEVSSEIEGKTFYLYKLSFEWECVGSQ